MLTDQIDWVDIWADRLKRRYFLNVMIWWNNNHHDLRGG